MPPAAARSTRRFTLRRTFRRWPYLRDAGRGTVDGRLRGCLGSDYFWWRCCRRTDGGSGTSLVAGGAGAFAGTSPGDVGTVSFGGIGSSDGFGIGWVVTVFASGLTTPPEAPRSANPDERGCLRLNTFKLECIDHLRLRQRRIILRIEGVHCPVVGNNGTRVLFDKGLLFLGRDCVWVLEDVCRLRPRVGLRIEGVHPFVVLMASVGRSGGSGIDSCSGNATSGCALKAKSACWSRMSCDV